jgi:para-nitrobenzyl esterase
MPTSLISSGSAAGTRLMAGHNGNEAATFAAFLGDEATAPTVSVLTEIFGSADVLETYRRTRGAENAAVAVMGDERWAVPVRRVAEAQAPHAPVYLYRVDIAQPGLPHFLDGGHGMELGMVWDVPSQLAGSAPEPVREQTAELIHRSWVDFVRTGVPRPDWPRYDSSRPVFVFDEDSHVEHDPRREERLAWGDVSWQPGTWFPFS